MYYNYYSGVANINTKNTVQQENEEKETKIIYNSLIIRLIDNKDI